MKKVSRFFPVMAVVLAFLVTPAFAQQTDHQAATPPLVQLLQAKGILTPQEAATISMASSADEANAKLAQLLVAKGLISQQDYVNMMAASGDDAHLMDAVGRTPAKAGSRFGFVREAPPQEPAVIPAITPPRNLPIDPAKDPAGLIPDVKLGSGAMLNLYGFVKATAIYDSTSSGGATFGNNDFPLPLLLADTGPDSGSQFHAKIRSSRIGASLFFPKANSDLIITGRIEADFEGDFTTVNNRNVSSLRSPQLSLRLAWVRVDTKFGDLPVFLEAGQDWTLVASSTFSDLIETTQAAAFFGNIYERIPQIKAGIQFHAGEFKFQPEVAVVMNAFGDANLAVAAPSGAAFPLNSTAEQNNPRFGARIGSDSGEPGVQARLVFQYPFFHQKGVAPAQFIISGGHSEGAEIVPHGTLSTAGTTTNTLSAAIPNCATPTLVDGVPECSIANFFPTGFRFTIPQNVFTAEWQVPTPWISFWGKYYRGGDLRFFFGSTLNTTFAALNGQPSIGNTIGLSGDTIQFVNVGGTAQFVPLVPVRSQGGFFEIGVPISRVLHADPEGHNAGWNWYLYGGVDSSFARDVRQSGANGLLRSDYVATSLRYKINRWAQIVNEVTWYDTHTADNVVRLFRGTDARTAHDIRNEFGTILTF
jgi:hypothetical protein